MLSETNNCYLCGGSEFKSIVTKWKDEDNKEEFKIVECLCGFKFLNPRPAKSHISKYYHSKIYHPHSKGKGLIYFFFNLSKKLTYRWKLNIMRKQVSSEIFHLDYGSGDSSFVEFLNKKGLASFAYDEFYVNNKSIDINKRKFNLITLWHSLEHIHDLDALFSKIDDILISKGKLILAVPNFDAPEREYFPDDWKAYDIPRHLYHFNSNSLNRLLEIKGYRVLGKKRMLLDTIYISLLSKNKKNSYIQLCYIIIKSIIKVIIRGPNFSSSLLYICEKNN